MEDRVNRIIIVFIDGSRQFENSNRRTRRRRADKRTLIGGDGLKAAVRQDRSSARGVVHAGSCLAWFSAGPRAGKSQGLPSINFHGAVGPPLPERRRLRLGHSSGRFHSNAKPLELSQSGHTPSFATRSRY
jgi:hypothetical protein